jgi:hypothetical protein
MKKANKANSNKKATSKKANKAKGGDRKRHSKVFGEFTVSSTLRALGKAGVKNAEGAAKAIKRYAKANPPISLVRSLLYVGRKNLGSAPAKLSSQQLRQLKSAAA